MPHVVSEPQVREYYPAVFSVLQTGYLFALDKLLLNNHLACVSRRARKLTIKGCSLVCSAFVLPEREYFNL